MPRLSIWSIRLALIYLLLGFTLGALMLANDGVPFAPWALRLLPGHIDILLFGFIAQLVIGVAYWILPRYHVGVRGNEKAVLVCLILLNAGVWTAVLTGWFNLPVQWMVAARLLEGMSAALFALQVWRRIRPA